MWVNELLRMFSRWPSSGGCSLSMDSVRPTAICAMAAAVSATGPPSPMFSPAAVQMTPAVVSLAPSDASPGHWWERPQPLAISWLCAAELASRPAVTVSAGSLAVARAWLISASTWAAAVPPWSADELDTGVVAPAAAGWALAVPVADPDDRRDDVREDGDAPAATRLDGIVTTVGGTAT